MDEQVDNAFIDLTELQKKPSAKRKRDDLPNSRKSKKRKADLNEREIILISEFEKALEQKDIAKVKLLLADLSESEIEKTIYSPANKKKLSPLHHAVLNGDLGFLENLLSLPKIKLLINRTDKFRETPIFYAVKNQQLEMVKLLLTHGAIISKPNSHKKTVLHHAIDTKNITCIKLLLDNGASELCHQYDDWDKLPFHSACKINIEDFNSGKIKLDEMSVICDLFIPYLNKSEIIKIDKYKKTLLHYAVSVLPKHHIEHLLSNGAAEVLNISDNYGKTVLHEAAKFGNLEAVELILANGGKELVNQKDHYDKSALHEAAIYKRIDVIKLLLQNGAEFDTKSKSSNLTAFEEAIKSFGDVFEIFDVFSPYMKKSEDEKQEYLHELLLKKAQQPPLAPHGFFSSSALGKHNRTQESFEDLESSPGMSKKLKTFSHTDTLSPNEAPAPKTSLTFFKPAFENESDNSSSSKTSISNASALPSQVNYQKDGTYWLLSDYSTKETVDHTKIGKWMLFYPTNGVDDAWNIIKKGIQDGTLWHAKVSTVNGDSNKHAIIVYTKDYSDVRDIIRVHDYLSRVGLKNSTLYYKTDKQTRSGVYSGTSQQKPWIYNSTMIEQLRKNLSEEPTTTAHEYKSSSFSYKQ